jgi:hypothetical protein
MIHVRRTFYTCAAALVAAAFAATATPAGATTPLALAKGGQAGFYVSPGSNVNSVHASFTAPTVTCASASGTQQLRFGVVSPQGNSTVSEFSQLNAVCTNGVLSYGAALGANGNTTGGAITPGDSLTVSLTISPSVTIATLVDHTTATTYRVSGAGQTLDQTAFIGERPTTGQSAIPTFSSPVSFSHLSVNGDRINVFTTLRYYQVSGTHVLVSTSPLSHGVFSLTFVANS